MKARALAACILAFISSGCKENERPTPDAQSSSTATWQLNDSGRWIVSLEGTKSDSNLQQAIAAGRRKARTTLAQAQLEWSALTASGQRDWAIVWAAPIFCQHGLPYVLRRRTSGGRRGLRGLLQ